MRVRHTLLALAIAGCAAPSAPVAPRPLGVATDPSEYVRYRPPGTEELAGQAFLTTRGGDVKLAAGRSVTLDPATTYALEWFRRFGADVNRFDAMPPDSLFVAARRTTVANAEGRFRFPGLPAGDYIVRTTVTWEIGGAYGGPQGGVVAALVSIKEGPQAELVLNQLVTPDVAAAIGVVIVDDEGLTERSFRVIGRVTGRSCQGGTLRDNPATEELARQDIVVNAARQGADAVAHLACVSHGASIVPYCTSRVECAGDAIAWN